MPLRALGHARDHRSRKRPDFVLSIESPLAIDFVSWVATVFLQPLRSIRFSLPALLNLDFGWIPLRAFFDPNYDFDLI